MGNTWGRKVPLKEVLRKNKREINKAVRELDRDKRAEPLAVPREAQAAQRRGDGTAIG